MSNFKPRFKKLKTPVAKTAANQRQAEGLTRNQREKTHDFLYSDDKTDRWLLSQNSTIQEMMEEHLWFNCRKKKKNKQTNKQTKKTHQLRIIYLRKISFKNKGEIKILSKKHTTQRIYSQNNSRKEILWKKFFRQKKIDPRQTHNNGGGNEELKTG